MPGGIQRKLITPKYEINMISLQGVMIIVDQVLTITIESGNVMIIIQGIIFTGKDNNGTNDGLHA